MRSFFSVAALAGLLLTDGHVDYAPRLVDGQLRSQLKHGAVWHDVSAVTFSVPVGARTAVPASAAFLGAPGDTVWVLPQTQRADLLWVGWNTEALTDAVVDGPVTWRLDAVEGPGTVTVFQTGVFGEPDVLFRSADGLPDTRTVPLGTHAHGNWAFTREGAYRLTFTVSARLHSGTIATDTQTLAVTVGTPLTPTPAPTTTPAPTSSPTPAPGADTPPEQSRPVSAPSLSARSARVAGRTLRLRIALDRRARVAVELRRGARVAARTKPRTVPAGTRTLRLRLSRRPAAGRHLVRITATTDGRSRTRTIAVRVRN